MTTPYPSDPSGIQAALARRLGIVLPTGQTPFDPTQFAIGPKTYLDQDSNPEQSEQAAMNQKQYMENSRLFNTPTNSNRRRSQNVKNADTSAAVIY